MGFFSKIFGSGQESAYKTCLKIYEKAKNKKPGKSERDYLKVVLLTKPPFDYQHDQVIEGLLDDNQTIEALAKYIAEQQNLKTMWEFRERNLKHSPRVKDRTNDFLREFWSS